MSCGAGGALNVALKTLLDPGDEVVIFAPYFVEYFFYADNHGGTCTVVPPVEGFLPDIEAFEAAIGDRTRVALINSPNNPSGVLYSEDVLDSLAGIISRKEERAWTRDIPCQRRTLPQAHLRRRRVSSHLPAPHQVHRCHLSFQGPCAAWGADWIHRHTSLTTPMERSWRTDSSSARGRWGSSTRRR